MRCVAQRNELIFDSLLQYAVIRSGIQYNEFDISDLCVIHLHWLSVMFGVFLHSVNMAYTMTQ